MKKLFSKVTGFVSTYWPKVRTEVMELNTNYPRAVAFIAGGIVMGLLVIIF